MIEPSLYREGSHVLQGNSLAAGQSPDVMVPNIPRVLVRARSTIRFNPGEIDGFEKRVDAHVLFWRDFASVDRVHEVLGCLSYVSGRTAASCCYDSKKTGNSFSNERPVLVFAIPVSQVPSPTSLNDGAGLLPHCSPPSRF